MSVLNVDTVLLTEFLDKKNDRPLFMPMWEPQLEPPAGLWQEGDQKRRFFASDIDPSSLIENAELIYNLKSRKNISRLATRCQAQSKVFSVSQ